MTKLKVVTIGGGSGAPAVLRALIDAGISNITAICAASDSGGKTGIIRSDERDRVIAISDLFRNLLALIPPSVNHKEQVQTFIDTISFIDGRNRNLGYTLYYALLEKYQNNFSQVQRHLERLLDIKFAGRAIPVSLEPSNIAFMTASGRKFLGEHELDAQSMSRDQVSNVWLEPQVKATAQAMRAVQSANLVIFCPGSIYGSVLANVLPSGMKQALIRSKARKILITNLVSDRNQTHNINVSNYLSIFRKYTGLTIPFNSAITPKITRMTFNRLYPEVAKSYALEHSYFLGKTSQNPKGVTLIEADIFNITPKLNRIRHDSEKLSSVFREIITAI